MQSCPRPATLRDDLRLRELICQRARQHAGAIPAAPAEVSPNPALNDVAQNAFVEQPTGRMHDVCDLLHDVVHPGDHGPSCDKRPRGCHEHTALTEQSGSRQAHWLCHADKPLLCPGIG